MGIRLVPKQYPASPDPALRVAVESEATVARFAHVNALTYEFNDIKHYTLDLALTNALAVESSKGMITVLNMDDYLPSKPAPSLGSFATITLSNPDLVIGFENVYVQLTPYYKRLSGDNVVPYIIASEFVTSGINLKVYNLSPLAEGVNQWKGVFQIHYELKSLV
jgi:hypothetical protein